MSFNNIFEELSSDGKLTSHRPVTCLSELRTSNRSIGHIDAILTILTTVLPPLYVVFVQPVPSDGVPRRQDVDVQPELSFSKFDFFELSSKKEEQGTNWEDKGGKQEREGALEVHQEQSFSPSNDTPVTYGVSDRKECDQASE